MPLYSYKAVKPDGEAVDGEREAVDEAALVRSLQADGLIPIKTRVAGGLRLTLGARRRALSQKEIGILTRELATLLEEVRSSVGLTLDPKDFKKDNCLRQQAKFSLNNIWVSFNLIHLSLPFYHFYIQYTYPKLIITF